MDCEEKRAVSKASPKRCPAGLTQVTAVALPLVWLSGPMGLEMADGHVSGIFQASSGEWKHRIDGLAW